MRDDILIVDEEFYLPPGLCKGALLASNGLFTFNRLAISTLPLVDIVQKIGPGYTAEGMKPYQEQIKMYAPKITRVALMEVESFFREVYRLYRGEAIVFLYFTPAQGGKWKFIAIPQQVNGADLKWQSPGPAPSGWYLAGSFHSHHNMTAFHSPTDNSDELGWNGIHVTIGKIFNPTPEYAASVVIGGVRYKIGIEDLVEPESVTIPSEWMGQVKKYESTPVQPSEWLVIGGQPTQKSRFIEKGAKNG